MPPSRSEHAPQPITPCSYVLVGLLGATAWWYVAVNTRPPTGTVVLHTGEFAADVEAVGGGELVRIRGHTRDAVSVELPAGTHELVIRRGTTILSRETFAVRGGEEVVLTAWQRPQAGRYAAGHSGVPSAS